MWTHCTARWVVFTPCRRRDAYTSRCFDQLLDELLKDPKYAVLDKAWAEEDRREMTMYWHKLDGMSTNLTTLIHE